MLASIKPRCADLDEAEQGEEKEPMMRLTILEMPHAASLLGKLGESWDCAEFAPLNHATFLGGLREADT